MVYTRSLNGLTSKTPPLQPFYYWLEYFCIFLETSSYKFAHFFDSTSMVPPLKRSKSSSKYSPQQSKRTSLMKALKHCKNDHVKLKSTHFKRKSPNKKKLNIVWWDCLKANIVELQDALPVEVQNDFLSFLNEF